MNTFILSYLDGSWVNHGWGGDMDGNNYFVAPNAPYRNLKPVLINEGNAMALHSVDCCLPADCSLNT